MPFFSQQIKPWIHEYMNVCHPITQMTNRGQFLMSKYIQQKNCQNSPFSVVCEKYEGEVWVTTARARIFYPLLWIPSLAYRSQWTKSEWTFHAWRLGLVIQRPVGRRWLRSTVRPSMSLSILICEGDAWANIGAGLRWVMRQADHRYYFQILLTLSSFSLSMHALCEFGGVGRRGRLGYDWNFVSWPFMCITSSEKRRWLWLSNSISIALINTKCSNSNEILVRGIKKDFCIPSLRTRLQQHLLFSI